MDWAWVLHRKIASSLLPAQAGRYSLRGDVDFRELLGQLSLPLLAQSSGAGGLSPRKAEQRTSLLATPAPRPLSGAVFCFSRIQFSKNIFQ